MMNIEEDYSILTYVYSYFDICHQLASFLLQFWHLHFILRNVLQDR